MAFPVTDYERRKLGELIDAVKETLALLEKLADQGIHLGPNFGDDCELRVHAGSDEWGRGNYGVIRHVSNYTWRCSIRDGNNTIISEESETWWPSTT